jgi:hypothetical protein
LWGLLRGFQNGKASQDPTRIADFSYSTNATSNLVGIGMIFWLESRVKIQTFCIKHCIDSNHQYQTVLLTTVFDIGGLNRQGSVQFYWVDTSIDSNQQYHTVLVTTVFDIGSLNRQGLVHPILSSHSV